MPAPLKNRLRAAVLRRRELCARLTGEPRDAEPTPEEQDAWKAACERVRSLRARAARGEASPEPK